MLCVLLCHHFVVVITHVYTFFSFSFLSLFCLLAFSVSSIFSILYIFPRHSDFMLDLSPAYTSSILPTTSTLFHRRSSQHPSSFLHLNFSPIRISRHHTHIHLYSTHLFLMFSRLQTQDLTSNLGPCFLTGSSSWCFLALLLKMSPDATTIDPNSNFPQSTQRHINVASEFQHPTSVLFRCRRGAC